jgi:hypothetical protein
MNIDKGKGAASHVSLATLARCIGELWGVLRQAIEI